MKTSKSPSSARKDATARATTASPAKGRGRAKPSAKKPATPRPSRPATARAKPAGRPMAKKAAAVVAKAVKKVAAPKDDLTRVHDLLSEFSTVMFVTSEGEASAVRARPMSVARLEDDCTLAFLTGAETAKVHEAKKDSVGHVIAQGRTVFVSLRGAIEVVRDRARIHAAWSPAAKIYFPKGESDPDLCLLVLHPVEAEIWDVSGTKGIAYLFEAARALFTGERPRRDATGTTHDLIALGAPATA